MAQPFIGEIRMFGGNFPPRGWAFCDGQLLSIAENQPLFALIGTTYGGDGQTTFAMPDLRGRVPLHQGQGPGLSPRVVGGMGGSETVALAVSQLPAHSHRLASVSAATLGDPTGKAVANTGAAAIYGGGAANVAMDPAASVAAGGSQPHNNLMPYLGVSFIICLEGIFPSQA